MPKFPLLQTLAKWLAAASFLAAFLGTGLGSGLAYAQAEPTLTEIYATAQSGKLDQAQVMIQQVLISHPNSAKAYYVQAELFARQGKAPLAAESLGTAEKLAPGLPFAKPQAVEQLRTQIATSRSAAPPATRQTHSAVTTADTATTPSWAIPLLLVVGVIGMGYFLFRKKRPAALPAQSPLMGSTPGIGSGLNNNGLSGSQAFGNAANPAPAMAGGYAQPGYGQAGYGQPAGSGMGGRVMGGLATGLAVGAGVMAAQAIGKNLMGEHDSGNRLAGSPDERFEPLSGNNDMGGQDFGVNDAGSWDDGPGVSDGGGWDN